MFNLEELQKYFDHYTINARFMPAFFCVLPFVLSMLAWCPLADTIIGGTLTLLISFGVMAFISGLMSDLGNKLQDKLYISWGGEPTTIIMRYSDQHLDQYTKARYHQWLNAKVGNLTMPTPEQERADPEDANQKYRSATNFLREYSRDKSKFPRVYSDNVAYGFSRNLMAIRKFGLLVSVICVAINAYFILSVSNDNSIIDQSNMGDSLLGAGAGFVSIVFMLVFMFIINESLVKGKAFRYAKSLFEVCEVN